MDKAAKNLRKHGVGFDEASTVFFDPAAMFTDDPTHSQTESRRLVIGESMPGRVLVVIFTIRGSRYRFISARPASRTERGLYGQNRSFPL
jgi:uncharacterized DUF497 family protein